MANGLIDPERLRGTRGPQDGAAATVEQPGQTGAPTVPAPAMPTRMKGAADGGDSMIPKVPSGTPAIPKLRVPKGPTSAPGTQYQEVGHGLGAAPTREAAPGVGEGQPILGVSGRLKGLISRESPYIQRHRTKALQFANRRGLAASSIAAGAGEAAAIDAALPIAQADAGIAAGERQLRSTEFQQARQLRVDQ